jgi:hypothetical protein
MSLTHGLTTVLLNSLLKKAGTTSGIGMTVKAGIHSEELSVVQFILDLWARPPVLSGPLMHFHYRWILEIFVSSWLQSLLVQLQYPLTSLLRSRLTSQVLAFLQLFSFLLFHLILADLLQEATITRQLQSLPWLTLSSFGSKL